MKKLLLVFILIGHAANAQFKFPKNYKTGEVEYARIFEFDSIPANTLFFTGKQWFVDYYKSAKDVIQFESVEAGKIIGKGASKLTSTGMGFGGSIHKDQAGYFKYTVEIECKDNKIKVRIYNISHSAVYSGGIIENEKPDAWPQAMTLKTWYSIQELAHEEMKSCLLNIEKYYKLKTIKQNDW